MKETGRKKKQRTEETRAIETNKQKTYLNELIKKANSQNLINSFCTIHVVQALEY